MQPSKAKCWDGVASPMSVPVGPGARASKAFNNSDSNCRAGSASVPALQASAADRMDTRELEWFKCHDESLMMVAKCSKWVKELRL